MSPDIDPTIVPLPPGAMPLGASNPQPPPPPPQQKSPIEALALAVVHFPEFLVGYTTALLFAMLTDLVVFSLMIGSVLLGLVTANPLIGGAVFMLTYVLMRVVFHIPSAIGAAGNRIGAGLARLSPPPPLLPARPEPAPEPSSEPQ